MTRLFTTSASRTARLRPIALALLLWSCDGANGWQDLPTGPTNRRDTTAPQVDIQFPDTTTRVAVQDSVLVRVRVTDDVGVDSVVLSGFSLRGSAVLGTQAAVQRFQPKAISLRGAAGTARDTVLLRYLLPTADSLAERPVFIVATARDTVGNVRADTVRISIGGPRVQIREPAANADVRAGSRLRVRVAASDSLAPLKELTLRLRNSASGALIRDTTLRFEPPLARIDTLVELTVPTTAPAESHVQAVVRTISNDSAVSIPSALRVLAASRDQRPPVVTFSTTTRSRAETADSVVVSVSATDSSQVARVGATVRSIHRLATRTDTLRTLLFSARADSAAFRFSVAQLGVSEITDTSTLRIEVTAFAFDTTGNCGAATVPRTPLSEACQTRGDTVFAARSGARSDVGLVRGSTVRPGAGDRLVDLVVDSAGQRVFVSNHGRNRVDILPIGAAAFDGSISVGSEPWGLAIGARRDTLFVANSASTNISIVPLTSGTPVETGRIRTPDIQLFGINYDVEKDSVDAVRRHAYSDRPQFLGQLSSGQLLYSTKPTTAATPGTVRIFDPAKDTTQQLNRATEIFVNYAGELAGRAILVNALSAGLTTNRMMTVCPRRLRQTAPDPNCITGTPTQVFRALGALRDAGQTDTRLELGLDIATIALTDTTFTAVSRDHSTIAFGEGAVDPGRIFLFKSVNGALQGSSTETEDLLGNAAERVIGLALNGDGSLGVARGRQAYYFNDKLRLEGIVNAGPGTGGVSGHPANRGFPADDGRLRTFVSGVTDGGAPYIDVVNTRNFTTVRRIFIRDRVVGALVAAQVGAGDPDAGRYALRLFGITETGVLQMGLTSADLQ